jgi:hypothetical protein
VIFMAQVSNNKQRIQRMDPQMLQDIQNARRETPTPRNTSRDWIPKRLRNLPQQQQIPVDSVRLTKKMENPNAPGGSNSPYDPGPYSTRPSVLQRIADWLRGN